MAPGEPFICVRNLSKVFRSGGAPLVVLSGLELTVRRGEMVALVGESGAGKSTLLHLLGGLDTPSSGSVSYDGAAIDALTEDQRADFRNRTVGFLWQNHYLLPEFTALENVMMPLLIGGRPRAEAARLAHARLGEVGLGARATHRAGELSGGEQQRAALARALVAAPAVLLADEPTGNLDLRTGEAVFSLLEKLHRDHGLTSVLATHNMAFARRCTRVLSVEGGALVPR
jgi:lipoprotein-releasing system ATP-binding protein